MKLSRFLPLVLLFSAAALAQQYPGAIVTDSQLGVAANNCGTTLAQFANSTATTFTVASASCIVANMWMTIDSEIVHVCSVNTGANTFQVGVASCPNVDGRAYDGTSAATHNSSAAVTSNIDAGNHAAVAAELKAIETALGANLANVTVPNPLPINKGGTNAQTQAAALSNILGSSQVPIANGGTGASTASAALAALLSGSKQGTAATVQMAGTNSGVTGAPLCDDANGSATTSGCSGLPAASAQLQYLRVQPNTGNLTTAQFAALPGYNAADYAFPAQTCNGSNSCSAGGSNGAALVNGVAATLTLNPCPLGVTGADVQHAVYISGGVGTAEATAITGGTCTSGAASGTITFTPGQGHTGAWTIQSATGGIQEALVLAKAASGGSVRVAAGTVTTHAAVVLPVAIPVTLRGDGIGVSRILLANSSNCDVVTNENFAALTNSNTAQGGIFHVTIADLTIDANKANQSGTSWGIRIYGHGYTLRDLIVTNGLTGDIYSEYASNGGAIINTPNYDLETFWSNIRAVHSGGIGIQFRGPGDSYMEKITVYDHQSWCLMNQTGPNYGGTMHISDVDTYTCGLGTAGGDANPGACYTNQAFVGSSVVCSTAVGPGLLVDANAGTIYLSHAILGTNDSNASGLIYTGAGGVIMGGELQGGKYALTVGAGGMAGARFDTSFNCPGTTCINLNTGSAGWNIITGVAFFTNNLAPGPLYTGTIQPTDSITLKTYGAGVGYGGTQQYFTRVPNQSAWNHYHVVKTAGNWVINGGTGVAAAAATTQSLTLDTTGVGAFVDAARIQTAVAFTGTTTAVVSAFGNSGSITNYYSGSYDLKAAVSGSNLVDIRPSSTAASNGSQALQFQITTTGANVSAIADGASIDIWVKWGVLQ